MGLIVEIDANDADKIKKRVTFLNLFFRKLLNIIISER